jgi:hypothetical protein
MFYGNRLGDYELMSTMTEKQIEDLTRKINHKTYIFMTDQIIKELKKNKFNPDAADLYTITFTLITAIDFSLLENLHHIFNKKILMKSLIDSLISGINEIYNTKFKCKDFLN